MSGDAQLIKILESFWPKNKAKGLLAQATFMQEVRKGSFGADADEKIFSGCWLLSPKGEDFYKFRFCFFVHPKLMTTGKSGASPREMLGDKFRPFHAISEFMDNAGIGVIYAVPATEDGKLPLDNLAVKNFEGIKWYFHGFQNGKFIPRDAHEFFERWDWNRGRASFGGGWDPLVRNRLKRLGEDILTELLINELFYTGFIKGTLKKPLNDPYDVDSFMMSLSQRYILPMEIKEKFAGENRDEKFFGIDAGRIMMLLRLCIANDSNAVYLVRELSESGDFIGWKYVTLSDIIMTAGWNLQAGGPGMGGQSTQTIRLPYAYFKPFDAGQTAEDNLKAVGNLPRDAKKIARQFGGELSARFSLPEGLQ